MKSRIAAFLMSMAMTINGGPIEIEEADIPNDVQKPAIVETIKAEAEDLKTTVVNGVETAAHQAKEKLDDAKETITDTATKTWGKVSTAYDKAVDAVIFWD